jgi:hypothetical protein
VSLLDRLVEFFLRANAYSLVADLGVSAADVADRGPGSFSGPFVGAGQALIVLVTYLVALLVCRAGFSADATSCEPDLENVAWASRGTVLSSSESEPMRGGGCSGEQEL